MGPVDPTDESNPPDRFTVIVSDVLDLHAFAPCDTKTAVEAYLEEADRLGLTALRIIHGRGIGAQRQLVRRLLAQTPFVLDFRDAPADAGGWGATLVTLRPAINPVR